MASEGQEFGGDSVGWFWLRVFHKVAVKLLVGATPIKGLDWGCKFHFQAYIAVLQEISVPCHLGLPTGLLTVWQPASPRASD